MEQAAPVYQQRYTRPDGSFVWRARWPGFGEHRFTTAHDLDTGSTAAVDDRHLEVVLPPGRALRLRLDMRRFCHVPSYRQPW